MALKNQSSRTNSGRRVAELPGASELRNPHRAALLRSLERNDVLREENRRLQVGVAAAKAKEVRDGVEWIALTRCRTIASLAETDPRLRKITNLVLARFDAHVAPGEPGERFKVYDVWNEVRARVMAEGESSDGAGLASFRPRPESERARMSADELRAEDAALREHLRRSGIEDPRYGQRGNGSTLGY